MEAYRWPIQSTYRGPVREGFEQHHTRQIHRCLYISNSEYWKRIRLSKAFVINGTYRWTQVLWAISTKYTKVFCVRSIDVTGKTLCSQWHYISGNDVHFVHAYMSFSRIHTWPSTKRKDWCKLIGNDTNISNAIYRHKNIYNTYT